MGSREPTPEALETSRDRRVVLRRIVRQDAMVQHLRSARRLRVDGSLDTTLIDASLAQSEDELEHLQAVAGGRIERRKRAKKVADPARCFIYIDECGAHSLASKDKFRAFVLAAVIVRDRGVAAFEESWKDWKVRNLGSPTRKIHEPDVRYRNRSFYFGGDRDKQDDAIAALSDVLDGLDFSAVACVLHRDEYVRQFGVGSMDESLPNHGYLMTLHFMAERLALALQEHFHGATAQLVFEARGPKEDAEMQYEFARLLLDGTSYLSPSYFRNQFLPGLLFKSKDDHVAGLEVADLVARPCGEKVLSPASDPARWKVVRSKLCSGSATKHSILGLKITPWSDEYVDLWKS